MTADRSFGTPFPRSFRAPSRMRQEQDDTDAASGVAMGLAVSALFWVAALLPFLHHH